MTKEDIKLILKEYRQKRRFSKWLGFSHLLTTASYFFNSDRLRVKSFAMRDRAIFKYLDKYTSFAFEKNKDLAYDSNVDSSKEPIFVCWLQGEDNAPKLVKRCLESIRQNAGSHPVNFVSLQNIDEFIEIPAYIMEKFKSGNLCAANFSDYIRNSLLFKYGGLWLDATVFSYGAIPEWIFERDFYTVRFGFAPDSENISKGRWTGFIIGGRKNYPFFGFFKNCFEAYWETENEAIDYFAFDYYMSFFYDKADFFKQDVDTIPIHNQNIFSMQFAINRSVSFSDWKFEKGTFFYKLSWHNEYAALSSSGNETVYNKLIEGKI